MGGASREPCPARSTEVPAGKSDNGVQGFLMGFRGADCGRDGVRLVYYSSLAEIEALS